MMLELKKALVVLSTLAAGLTACGSDDGAASRASALTVRTTCLENAATAPQDAWVCPAKLSVACDDKANATLFVHAPQAQRCQDLKLQVSQNTFQAAGLYDISVYGRAATSAPALCTAKLEITDTKPPQVTDLGPLSLWPPNHKTHTVTVDDCVRAVDNCSKKVDVRFTWASSDEPQNDIGDGNTDRDITFNGCGSVALRSERQGGSDGRVYRLGWRATDEVGNAVEGICTVAVAHDQSGRGAAFSGEAYRVAAPASCK
ncbi:MAG: hypothetical protein KC503_17170 [Myxococcales bacterium]|nr:hypothetical protein [Myxococcales bacterium]